MVKSFASHPFMPFHKWMNELVALQYGQMQMFLNGLGRLNYNNQRPESGFRVL